MNVNYGIIILGGMFLFFGAFLWFYFRKGIKDGWVETKEPFVYYLFLLRPK